MNVKSPQKYCFGRGVPDYFWLLPGVLLLGRPGSGLGFGGRPYAAMKAKKLHDVKQAHFDAWFNHFNYVSECAGIIEFCLELSLSVYCKMIH